MSVTLVQVHVGVAMECSCYGVCALYGTVQLLTILNGEVVPARYRRYL